MAVPARVHPRLSPSIPDNTLGSGERLALVLAAVLGVAARIVYTLHHAIDSDEPQHLHVVWAWTQGLVQYRDVFDNHAPLFHLALAPAVGLLGVRPDILNLVRWLMWPLVALSLWATFRIGRTLWSLRVAAWGVVACSVLPGFLRTSVEFRADDLWMLWWLLSLHELLGGRLGAGRAARAGLFLGAALMTSFKSILLLLALATAAIAVLVGHWGWRSGMAKGARVAPLLLAGFTLVPLTIGAILWRLGAFPAFVQCAIWHNVVPSLGSWRSWQGGALRWLLLVPALVIVFMVTNRLLRGGVASRPRQVVLFLTAMLYVFLLEVTWPLVTSQDFLVVTPLLALLAAAGVEWAIERVIRRRPSWVPSRVWATLAALVVVLELAAANRAEAAWPDRSVAGRDFLAEVLKDTRSGEYVMDLKGETVFRPRPFYYALEEVTRKRLELGLLPDTIADDVVRTHTHFAAVDNPDFPPNARRFLNDHFVPLGWLRVLGSALGSAGDAARTEWAFTVAYPERFVVIVTRGAPHGTLDAIPYDGPRLLQPGPHHYRPSPGEGQVAVVWAGAIERGLRPASFGGVND